MLANLLHEAILRKNVPQITLLAVKYAIFLGSSDIHIEPAEKVVRIRYRVDGLLRSIVEYPLAMHSMLVSRIKIMSNLKIDENRIPQDGRAQQTMEDGRMFDLRVSTLPTINGEKIVMRIQDRSRKIPRLEELGLDEDNIKLITKSISRSNGIILTTGPTGSGKTTTLYACLNILNRLEVNIMTIEDPVEIQLDGLNQSQILPAIDYSFAFGLRTALRQDPDIIMVGEIRDKETISVAIEAALTGHLVISTIHTNSAVDTITRLLNMGIPAFLITASIDTIIAQRLVRIICQNCKKEAILKPVVEKKLREALSSMPAQYLMKLGLQKATDPFKIFRGVGCQKCGQTGYHGRIGVYEILVLKDEIKEMILANRTDLEIKKLAIEQGMKTLEHDGVSKVLQGFTTPEEIYTIIQDQEG